MVLLLQFLTVFLANVLIISYDYNTRILRNKSKGLGRLFIVNFFEEIPLLNPLEISLKLKIDIHLERNLKKMHETHQNIFSSPEWMSRYFLFFCFWRFKIQKVEK